MVCFPFKHTIQVCRSDPVKFTQNYLLTLSCIFCLGDHPFVP
ncbi:unnamed protein product [Psylliodes chrysocephalus]|uniref:Uncharacterized protein n=1 Tax=Psylliodes chrysocephalus TaxID=3402493 RepID=A0A9P0DAQ3_9CUCU|nr:unnamed protein product [Psylliodes chrysocephala]